MRTSGFSLIEVAVVLFIIVLALGGILVPLSTQVEQRKFGDTQKILDETRDALLGYAVLNGRFPRPATSASNGTERAANCTTEAQCTGFIPWVTLGVNKLDSHGKLIMYSVTPAYANTATLFTLATAGTKTIRERDTVTPFALRDVATGVPVLLFSFGGKNYGTSETGTTIADGSSPNTNIDEDVNATATVTFIARPFTASTSAPGGEFDDQVVWISRSQITYRMTGAAKLP